jgi:hypothetical protein
MQLSLGAQSKRRTVLQEEGLERGKKADVQRMWSLLQDSIQLILWSTEQGQNKAASRSVAGNANMGLKA